jgi:serine/threonine-protein kinase
MGTVYLVDHGSLGRQFALKILAPDLVNKQNWLRFEAEAKTMASLNHRTFVRVYDLGVHLGSTPFYSMDYLSGRTLEAMLAEEGPIEASQALDIFIEVLDGLAYAHRNGIIHRDIKPGNIMICNSGSNPIVKILDFGISKLIGSNTKDPQDLTAIGEIFGSPYYMSPEQCSGGAVDGRSDIYSLGCTLFEVLTGFVPFEGASFVETVMMHQEQDPPELSKILPHRRFSHSIELVVAKCLAKLPQERYQSAKEMSIDLTRIKEGKDLRDYYDKTEQNKLARYHGNNDDSSKKDKRIGVCLAFVSLVFAALTAPVLFIHIVDNR